jgi:hypothetical protein
MTRLCSGFGGHTSSASSAALSGMRRLPQLITRLTR